MTAREHGPQRVGARGVQLSHWMPLRAAIVACLIAGFVARPVSACITTGDTVEDARARAEEIAHDRSIQELLVPKLVETADTIVVARALRQVDRGLRTEFLILQVVKGDAAGGATRIFQASPSVPPIACTMPSEVFRNTATVEGQTYLLYVRGGRLLRAMASQRSQADLTVEEELKLIAKASNTSLERSSDR